ncbi:MAG: hypothetical protein H6570_06720 [Lewinellaceae bacterium]|nr:hypothetical protein [Lewinellaceae bacterium]
MKSIKKTSVKADPAISYPVLGFHHANLREGFKGDKGVLSIPGLMPDLHHTISILITNVVRIIKSKIGFVLVQ